MKAEIALVREGRMTFAEFAQATSVEWDRLARRMWSRWRPRTLDVCDLRNLMLAEAWQRIPTADETRGCPARYVVWNACAIAEREINRARGAARLSSKAPSREAALAEHFYFGGDSREDLRSNESRSAFRAAASDALSPDVRADIARAVRTAFERLDADEQAIVADYLDGCDVEYAAAMRASRRRITYASARATARRAVERFTALVSDRSDVCDLATPAA